VGETGLFCTYVSEQLVTSIFSIENFVLSRQRKQVSSKC
jgi:hypothetical protein